MERKRNECTWPSKHIGVEALDTKAKKDGDEPCVSCHQNRYTNCTSHTCCVTEKQRTEYCSPMAEANGHWMPKKEHGVLWNFNSR